MNLPAAVAKVSFASADLGEAAAAAASDHNSDLRGGQ